MLLTFLIITPFFVVLAAIIFDEDSYVLKDWKAKKKYERENNINNWKAKPPKRKVVNKKVKNSKITEFKRKSS